VRVLDSLTFRRTLQEALAASSNSLICICNEQASWRCMLSAADRHFDYDTRKSGSSPPGLPRPQCEYFARLQTSRKNRWTVTLDDLIWASRDWHASDSRDHIYALLGLVTPLAYQLFDADYSKSTSWAYQKAMVHIMHTRQNLDNLIFAVRQNVPCEPSWCIDFSRKDRLSNTSLGAFQMDYRAKHGV
jgi:hypothetical protein